MTVKLPLPVLKQAAEADALLRRIARESKKRGGRPRSAPQKPVRYVGFAADTLEEIDACTKILERVVGTPTPGNKRRGRVALCADLITCFLELRRRGIKPPRWGSLSEKAFVFGVADVLIRHSEMDESDFAATVKNGDRRKVIGSKHARLFGDIARAIEEKYTT